MVIDDTNGSPQLARWLDQQEIRDVVYRYCRGIDRHDYELVRGCYHSDAIADYGDFRGGVEDLIAHIQTGQPRFHSTMHFIGNTLVEPHPNRTRARSESYVIAYHHLRETRTKPERDYTVGLRYVDDFERRNGEWRIATRVCVFEWSRIDLVAPGGWKPADVAALGQVDGSDVVFAESIADWLR